MVLLKRFTLGICLTAIVLLAILQGGLRLAVGYMSLFKSEIEYVLTGDEASEIVFANLGGTMNRFNPVVYIENLSLNLPDRSQSLFIDRLEVEFDFWASLRQRTPVALTVSGQLEKLKLKRDLDGRWWANVYELGGNGSDGEMPELTRVLALAPRYLRLDLRRLLIEDEITGNTHQIDRVAAYVDHRGDQYYLRASAVLPSQLGRGLLLKSVLGPDSSVIYVNTSDLRLNPVAQLFGLDTWGLREGALDGEAWFNLSGSELVAINGDFLLKQGVVQTADDRKPLTLSYRTRFNAFNHNTSWQIINNFERLRVDDKYVPGFRAQLELVPGSDRKQVSAWIDRLQLSSLPAIAAQVLPAKLNQQIEQGRIKGLLQDFVMSIDLERPQLVQASGRVYGIDSQVVGNIPGAKNINADVVVSGSKMGLELFGEDVTLDFGNLFRNTIELDQIDLTAALDIREGGLALYADRIEGRNEDIRINARGWLEADGKDRPFMFLRGEFDEVRAGSKSKYFPVSIMEPKTLKWLDEGILGGQVSDGNLLFHGRLLPIRRLHQDGIGKLLVDFRMEGGEVMFDREWLHATNTAGRIRFHNVGMSFDLDRVAYGKLDYARARGGISDFKFPLLNLSIAVEADTALTVETWLQTPVSEPFRETMRNFSNYGGEAETRIDIVLPLSKRVNQRKVKVAVDLRDAAAESPDWGVDLSEINGKLNIDDRTVTASGIKARFFGDPITVDVAGQAESGDTVINANGPIAMKHLLNRLPARFSRDFSGDSEWIIRLDIPAQRSDSEPLLRIDAASNLQNTRIDIPAPFAKPLQEARRLAANLRFFPQRIDFDATYGNDILARGQMTAPVDGEFELQGLELAFADNLKPRQTDGIKIFGYIPRMSLDQWRRYLASDEAVNPSTLRLADLQFDRLEAFNRTLESVAVEIGQTEGEFLGTVESSILRGSFRLPLEPTRQSPLVVELDYLRLDKLENEPDYSALRPEQLLDFRLTSEALVYHDMLFNDVLIEGRRGDRVFHIDNLKLRRDQVFTTANAKWQYDAESDTHTSSVVAKVQGENLGKAIAQLGFGDSMRNGKVEMNGGFTWPAPLLGFDVENLTGDAKLRIEDGVLNNVEPGSGRFVGLLSLSALPRRLSLDFSDLLIKGMEFDTITGSYRIDKGILHTNNTRMDGPAAKIKITGKTGIAARDYDQKIVVTPKIRHTLPVIGAVSAGSTVGWGLLLLQNLFKKSIDKAVEVEYRITGSWDDPQIELIKAVDENQRELPEIKR